MIVWGGGEDFFKLKFICGDVFGIFPPGKKLSIILVPLNNGCEPE